MASSASGGLGPHVSLSPPTSVPRSVSSMPIPQPCGHAAVPPSPISPILPFHYLPYCPHAFPARPPARASVSVLPAPVAPVSMCLSPPPPIPTPPVCVSPACLSPFHSALLPHLRLSPCPRSVSVPRPPTPVHASVSPTWRGGEGGGVSQSIMASSISRKSLCMGTFPPSLMP